MTTAASTGFGMFIVSATTPFTRDDLPALRSDPAAVLRARFPQSEALFAAQDNARARAALGWWPCCDFRHVLDSLAAGGDFGSELARAVGANGYHDEVFGDGPYPM